MLSYNWNWSILFQQPQLGWLLEGLRLTIVMAAVSFFLALAIGTLVGMARTARSRAVRGIGWLYTALFRNVPLLIQMFLWFYVFPELLPQNLGRWVKRDLYEPEVTIAVICLSFYMAARMGEQIRAGIQAVPRGFISAALASGLTVSQIRRYIVMPICLRMLIPPLTTELLATFKNTSLALAIGVLEITARSHQIESSTFHGFEAFAAATFLYVAISLFTLALVLPVENATRLPGMLKGRS
ncbi:glutamate ABC transporter permease [Bradyrhizobium sp. CCBAU 65884]|uniref:amino acid ABC transporter permease n=1 Tax=Bradyrhizobium sp. CCBAU 65884 TaxID=722477 RepID=UPI0023051FDB|nr:amino acid ABC transporter permease [Bradyrhizobium sp. CCBAU 65884]MDA9476786.1 glutamate ABC transporter permease [Bradyrhizobium sp. CCBAU 65884]